MDRLRRWGDERGWVGPDPYEGLNATRLKFMRRNPLGRRALIQLVKRSPLDLRRPLGIEPRVDAASLAHVLSSCSRLESGFAATDGQALDRALAGLRETRCAAFPEPCWGYHFDVETRFFFYGSGTPNTIASAFAGHALLDAHLATGRPELLELAAGVGEFFLTRIGLNEGYGGSYFGYFPGDRTAIHNANALTAALLARLHAQSPRPELLAAASAGTRFVLSHQGDDGSWRYAEGPHGSWVDNLHTGYVLDSLRLFEDALPGAEKGIEEAYARGLDFYARNLFLADGTPKFLADAVLPVDGQNAAQAIRTFALASVSRPQYLELAWRTFEFADSRMSRPDGAFLFQRSRLWVNRVPHVRWVQAPMLDALSRLLVASRPRERAA